MSFHVGQKVVCIRHVLTDGEPPPYLAVGGIYTVGGFERWFGEELLLIVEAPRHNHSDWSQGYGPEDFRPITDISFAHEILRKVTRKDRVRA